MIRTAQRLLWLLFFVFTVLPGLMFAPGVAAGQEIEGLHGSAAKAVESRIYAEGLRYPQASIFYGDLTGKGTNDAISFIYYDIGGSAPQLTTWIWLETEGDYTLARTVSPDEVFGLNPRNVTFTPGRIVVTTTVPQANDPHCCPTGERTFTLDTGTQDGESSGMATNRPQALVQSNGNWTATIRSNPAMVNVRGTATDGQVTFHGGCNTLLPQGFGGSLYDYGGEALQRVDDQSEAVVFDVIGRRGTESFPERMHYFAADEAWVITGRLPAAFLDAFARGNTLIIRNDEGQEVVAFGLDGSSKAVQTMNQICGR